MRALRVRPRDGCLMKGGTGGDAVVEVTGVHNVPSVANALARLGNRALDPSELRTIVFALRFPMCHRIQIKTLGAAVVLKERVHVAMARAKALACKMMVQAQEAHEVLLADLNAVVELGGSEFIGRRNLQPFRDPDDSILGKTILGARRIRLQNPLLNLHGRLLPTSNARKSSTSIKSQAVSYVHACRRVIRFLSEPILLY